MPSRAKKSKPLKEQSESVDFILETSKGNFLIEKRLQFLLSQMCLEPLIDHHLREYCLIEGKIYTFQGHIQPAKNNLPAVMVADKPMIIYEGDYHQVENRLKKKLRWLLFQSVFSLTVLASILGVLLQNWNEACSMYLSLAHMLG
ncbi:hypothetical protein Lnau_2374 [Legionella nautarum]|uniref:Uncharacterized protein n=1 Tax=Legionella nautarum TaxID=45070 RepID=A0A0W0WKT4_9GAMM|nr:hypothetical protein [Legionella nautarum]KTD32726.1 hypothetical protein Lnau_2374 [Legionella nautarum]